MAHYTISATNSAGAMALQQPLTVQDALHKAVELRNKGFKNIKLRSVETGVEVTLDDFMRGRDNA